MSVWPLSLKKTSESSSVKLCVAGLWKYFLLRQEHQLSVHSRRIGWYALELSFESK